MRRTYRALLDAQSRAAIVKALRSLRRAPAVLPGTVRPPTADAQTGPGSGSHTFATKRDSTVATEAIAARRIKWTEVLQKAAASPPATAAPAVPPSQPAAQNAPRCEQIIDFSDSQDAGDIIFSTIRAMAKRRAPGFRAAASGVADPSTAVVLVAPAEPEVVFTQEQAVVLRMILDGASLFIGGKAGTGKSFLLREIAHRLKSGFGLRVAVTASTGVAALNIDGNTFHSTFGVPMDPSDGDYGRPQKAATDKAAARGIRFTSDILANIDVIIVDEVSMLHAGYLESLERAARVAAGRDPTKPFGGIQIILSGDFMQLTPFQADTKSGTVFRNTADRIVCPGISKDPTAVATTPAAETTSAVAVHKRSQRPGHYVSLPLYESHAFQRCLVHVQLTHPVRQSTDPGFIRELNALRRGVLPFRLSRCAVLNKPDPAAIRLYAVKNAVKTHNDTRMLELGGAECVFRSSIQLHASNGTGRPQEDAGDYGGEGEFGEPQVVPREKAPPAPPPPTTTRTRNEATCPSDAVLLHLGTLRGKRSFSLRTAPIEEAAARAIVTDLCASTGVPPSDILSYVMPFSVSRYMANVSTVAVRCLGRNRAEAAARLSSVLRATERRIIAQEQRVPQREAGVITSSTVARRASARMPSSASLPVASMFLAAPQWQLLRSETYSPQRLSALLQPSFQHKFLRSVQRDFVLQNKRLKVGCRVMLLRNLNTRYVNGSLGTVEAFKPLEQCPELLPCDLKVQLPPRHRPRTGAASPGSGDGAKVPLVRMDLDGQLVAIPWVTLPLPATFHEGFFVGKVQCMPLTPAYAFTVHKIQGVTLDHPILFDGNGMFACDHLLYVAASRVKKLAQLRWINVSPRMISVHRPSLRFSDSIPTADEAQAQWAAWKNASKDHKFRGDQLAAGATTTELFLPTWRTRG